MKTGQRGVAIVLAMGVAALAAITATAIMVSQSTWARQRELAAGHVQAQSIVRAGIDWARLMLYEDRRAGSVDHLGEPWALKLTPIPFDNGTINGAIEDQQAAFNLNNLLAGELINRVELARLRRLLVILDLPPALADALADWIDADSEPLSSDGAEDGYYQALSPPYLAANRPLADVAELALVRGFDDAVRARLRPFVTALPRYTQLNINTASAEALAANIDGLDLDAARALVAQRERAYFTSAADLANRLAGRFGLPVSGVAFASDYFLVNVRVNVGAAQSRGAALLARESAGWPAVVWQKIQ
jgi:general secretion pathway protein K